MSPINLSEVSIVQAYINGETVQFKVPKEICVAQDLPYDPDVWYDVFPYTDSLDLFRLTNVHYEYRIKL